MLGVAPVIVSLVVGRMTEHADDVPGQMILDLAVSWDRLGHPDRRVAVPVVPRAMAGQDASEPSIMRTRSTRFTGPPTHRPCGCPAARHWSGPGTGRRDGPSDRPASRPGSSSRDNRAG